MALNHVESIRTEPWPRRYALVGLCFAAVFVCYLDRANISVAALAMQETFGWTETTKGLVLPSFFIGYLLFQVPAGYLANRYGDRFVLGVAVLWWSACTLVTPLTAAMSMPVLIAARIAMGAGEAATFPAAYNLFGHWIPQSERSRAVSLLLSGIPIGTLVALGASGWLVAHFGWPSVFSVFGALGFVWAWLWFTAIPSQDPSPREGRGRGPRRREGEGGAVPWRALLGKPAIWALIVNHFCSNWTLYVLLAWLTSYFRQAQGLSIAAAGLAAAAPWLTMFVMVNVAAWIADALVGRGVSLTAVRKTMQASGLLGSAAFLMLAADVADAGTAQLLMCGALGALAFTWSGFSPNHLDIAPRYAGVLMGVTNTAGTIPGVAGVAVTGWLVQTSGTYASAFLLTAAISLFGAVVWLLFATGKPVVE